MDEAKGLAALVIRFMAGSAWPIPVLWCLGSLSCHCTVWPSIFPDLLLMRLTLRPCLPHSLPGGTRGACYFGTSRGKAVEAELTCPVDRAQRLVLADSQAAPDLYEEGLPNFSSKPPGTVCLPRGALDIGLSSGVTVLTEFGSTGVGLLSRCEERRLLRPVSDTGGGRRGPQSLH